VNKFRLASNGLRHTRFSTATATLWHLPVTAIAGGNINRSSPDIPSYCDNELLDSLFRQTTLLLRRAA
jgi:hypothetical protein